MQVQKIDLFRLDCADTLCPVGCRVYTDTGLFGDGEAALGYGRGSFAALGALRDLAPLVLKASPLAHEQVWERLYRHSFWAQNGGPAVFAAISAIDMALWDIRGKYFGVPVWQLLGGVKRPLRAYASQLQTGWKSHRQSARTPQQYAENALAALEDGYTTLKIDFLEIAPDGGPFDRRALHGPLSRSVVRLFYDRVAAVRRAVGEEIDLIIENHGNTDTPAAVQLAQAVRELGIWFLEEGNTPTPQLLRQLHAGAGLPIAHGERIYTRWQYAPYLADGSIQIIQPDIGTAGGITEVKKICDMAATSDVAVQLHVCGTGLSTAAALQLEAALPNFLVHEHHILQERPQNRALTLHPASPVQGAFLPPDRPGLGDSWSPLAMADGLHYTVQ